MQSPTIVNPAVLVPVNPEIESYMRSLVTGLIIQCWQKWKPSQKKKLSHRRPSGGYFS